MPKLIEVFPSLATQLSQALRGAGQASLAEQVFGAIIDLQSHVKRQMRWRDSASYDYNPMKHPSLILAASLLLAGLAPSVTAENWPAWRGPRGDGTSLETSVPTEWSATRNIAWKTVVPGAGHSSPIVWDDRVFTATAMPEKKERALLCFDRRTGQILWRTTVLTADLESKNGENSFASCTPATDGERVYVAFLDIKQVVVAAFDFSGKQLWLVRPGEFQNDHGFSSSPVLYQDKVILSAQGKQGNFLVALSCADGHTLWKHALDNPSNSFGQPLARLLAGRPQIILCGDKAVTSFSPQDGARLWFVESPSTDSVITPVLSEQTGLLLSASSWPKKELQAIKPDGQGDVTKTRIVWRSVPGAPYVPSPIAVDRFFLTVGEAGNEIYCFDATTGQILWHERVGHSHASPVSAAGMVYFLNDKGVTQVIKAGDKYELVASNDLGEKCFASPAFSRGQIFLRGATNLYCVGRAEK
jgi:outer membrane protein assembly factor BamB